MARFHTLDVIDVQPETRDAVVVTLKPRAEDAEAFAFTQGQYLTFRQTLDGQEFRRSYSICAGLDEGALKVGIKRVQGGAFSNWANDNLKPGGTIEAMPPMGTFHLPLDPGTSRHYLGFSGGSGITPLLSIIKTTLAREPDSRFTLIYANRAVTTIMFREALEDLKNTYLGRFSVIHVLETEGQEVELFTGLLTHEKLGQFFTSLIDLSTIDAAFICGPEPMMLTIADSLKQHGLDESAIKFELFASGQPGRLTKPLASTAAAAAGGREAVITLDGTTRTVPIAPGQSLLQAALAADLDAPYACTAGVCSTCRAKVIEGEAEMAVNHALEDYEVRAGYVLSCQCIALSDRLVVTYDE